MKISILSAVAALLLSVCANASVCEAAYQAEGFKLSAWRGLGDVNGPAAPKNCLAMAKNALGNLKAAELGVSKKKICESGTIAVSITTRLSAKDKSSAADAVVKTALGVDCGSALKQNICHGDSDCEDCLHSGGNWDFKTKLCGRTGGALVPKKGGASK